MVFTGGSVSLNKMNPLGSPLIDLGFLTNPFDLAAMRQAFVISQKFFLSPVWEGYIVEQVLPPENVTSSDDALDAFIRSNVFSSQHAVGTAAMSSRDASYGVVNPDLLVKGANGLRIVDASVLVSTRHVYLSDRLSSHRNPYSRLLHVAILRLRCMQWRKGRLI